jgi:hypothetical protein
VTLNQLQKAQEAYWVKMQFELQRHCGKPEKKAVSANNK